MGVNVDTVYQRVLAILNKEQRGYLTPQNFNLFANQVQLDILESYFYDLETFLNMPGNDTSHADIVNILETKIAKFEDETGLAHSTGTNNVYPLPTDCYRLTNVLYQNNIVQRVSKKNLRYILISPLAKPSDSLPVFIEERQGVVIYGDAVFSDASKDADVSVDYIRTPSNVVWGYTTVLGSAQYNASTSTNFDLDPSEETDIVIKILALAGVEVKAVDIQNFAANSEAREGQQETR
jgi:hypothetical protein